LQKLEELDKKSADVEQRLESFLEEKETELSKLRSELAAIKAERDALMGKLS
jgi:vacuolar-type H+-ATPase subunit I/STV1